MTDQTKQAANSQLPDDEALAAFAQGAFGGSNRRRRRTEEAEKRKATTTEPAPTDAPAPVTAQPEQQPPRQTAEEAIPPSRAEQPPAEADAPSKTTEEPAKPAAEVTPQPEPAAVTVPAPAPAAEDPLPQRQEPPVQEEPVERREVAVRAVAAPSAHTPRPLAYRADIQIDQVQVPNLGPAGARATQCTIMVSHNVRERFAQYQLSKKMAGEKEPSNALVVRRAFLYCKRKDLFGKLLGDVYQQHNAVDDEDYDEDGMLGEVVGRRAVRGRLKDSGQQSFRPSEQELANYDAFTQAYGFPSRSDFLNAVLDEFLPQLPASGRRR